MMVTITTIGNPFSDEGKELILFGSNSAADVSVLKITEEIKAVGEHIYVNKSIVDCI